MTRDFWGFSMMRQFRSSTGSSGIRLGLLLIHPEMYPGSVPAVHYDKLVAGSRVLLWEIVAFLDAAPLSGLVDPLHGHLTRWL